MENDSLSVMELLEVLEDLLDNAKTAPFSSKVLVDKDQMYEVLKDVRLFLPNEIKQSKWVMEDRSKILVKAEQESDKIIKDAQQKAEEIIKDADVRASKLMKEHEIVKLAEQESERIMAETSHMSNEMRLGVMEYVDGLLADVGELFKNAYAEVRTQNAIIEECYTEKIAELRENRQELRESAKI